jgi:hypothetical protein
MTEWEMAYNLEDNGNGFQTLFVLKEFPAKLILYVALSFMILEG